MKSDFITLYGNRFEMSEECWNWTAGKFTSGYGSIRIKGKSKRANRVAYEMTFGAIPLGLEVCHSCDNPSCVNPDHLYLATHKKNMEDASAKKRMRCPEGPDNRLAAFSSGEILKIRQEWNSQSVNSMTLLAKKYGVSKAVMRKICRNLSYRNVTIP